MNLMHSGFLFVLFVLLEAISGLPPDNSKAGSPGQDLPSDHAVTEKSHEISESTVSESVKIIISSPVKPTPAPTNTSTAPNTTLTPPTTTPTPPTTTPTPPTTPPTPVPSPWIVRNDTTKKVCIIAQMSMELNITYPLKNGSLNHTLLNISKDPSVNGSCSEPTQSLVFKWGTGHSLQINFSANKSAKNFYVSGINLYVNATVFPDAKDNNRTWHFENKSSEFVTALDMSYKCNKVQDLNLKGNDEGLNAVLALKDTQLEAFMNQSAVTFGAAQNCDTFDTPDIVPIAVGCALAVLVLVVLVAYLIGRKHSQSRGYLSM